MNQRVLKSSLRNSIVTRTIKSNISTHLAVQKVMWWVETTQHHMVQDTTEFELTDDRKLDFNSPKPGGMVILTGHTDRLRIPKNIWKQCHVKSSGPFDNRMYRWDHEAAAVAAGFFKSKSD